MLGAEHLQRGQIQRRSRFAFALLFRLRLFGRRVHQQHAAPKADRQRQRPQRPESPPDALHRPEALERRSDKDGQERTGKSHRPADDAGGEALPALVPLLGAGLDGRVQERRAQPRRDAEHPKEKAALLPRQKGRRKEPAAEQGCAPERRAAGAFPVLQKAADDAPDAEGRDQNAKGIPGPLFAQAVLLHHRLLEHAPRCGQTRQHLNGRSCRQNGPRMFLGKLLHLSHLTL